MGRPPGIAAIRRSARGSHPVTDPRVASENAGLAQRTASSALWNGAGSAAVQVVALVTYVVLAWTLGPRQFGTVAMALALVALPRLLGDLGLAPAIVTRRLSGELPLLSAHWAVFGWGLAWAALLALGAPLAAEFYQNPEVLAVLQVAALLPAIDAAAVVPHALLQQRHRFDQIVMVDLACQLGIAVAAISMAAAGYGLWALVVPQVAGRATRSVCLCSIAPLRYRARFSVAALRARLSESAHVMSANSTSYLSANADNIIVGRFFGPEDLGRYSFAYNTLARSVSILSHAAAMPILASLGPLSGDPARFDAAVVRATRTVARLTFPLMLGGALVAPLAVEVFFGERWAGTEDLLRCFLALAAPRSIGALTGPVWLALGRYRVIFWWGIFAASVAIGAFITGALLGSVEWVAVCFAVGSAGICTPLVYQVTRRSCGLRLEGLLAGLGVVLMDVAIMLGVVALVGVALGNAAPATSLGLQVGSGALCYAGLLRGFHREELDELIGLLPRRAQELLRHALLLEGGGRALQPD
jgi:O-antigen/teichoic acid export membrane protein